MSTLEWYGENGEILYPDSIQHTGNIEEYIVIGYVLDKDTREKTGAMFLLVEQEGDTTLLLVAHPPMWERVISMLNSILEDNSEVE